MEDYNFHRIFERVVELFNYSNEFLRKSEDPEFVHNMVTLVMQKDMMLSTVQKFQSYLCIVIMEKIFD